MANGKGKIPLSYRRFEIIKLMHWDYITYQNQPHWFLDELNNYLEIESKYNQYLSRLHQRELNKNNG